MKKLFNFIIAKINPVSLNKTQQGLPPVKMAQEVTISTNPVFICGVNRKINIGNFENIDVVEVNTKFPSSQSALKHSHDK